MLAQNWFFILANFAAVGAYLFGLKKGVVGLIVAATLGIAYLVVFVKDGFTFLLFIVAYGLFPIGLVSAVGLSIGHVLRSSKKAYALILIIPVPFLWALSSAKQLQEEKELKLVTQYVRTHEKTVQSAGADAAVLLESKTTRSNDLLPSRYLFSIHGSKTVFEVIEVRRKWTLEPVFSIACMTSDSIGHPYFDKNMC